MKKGFRKLIGLGVLALFALVLAACAQVPQTQEVNPPSPTGPVMVEPTEAPEIAPEPTMAPAVVDTATPVPQPTQAAPTVIVEQRIAELEWPARMRLGDSDVVRLSLVPSEEGYQVTTEFPNHETQTQDIPLKRPGGYDLYGVARLDAVGFEISPEEEQTLYLPLGEPVTWRWALYPLRPGQQRLSVSLMLRWTPTGGVDAPVRESLAYSRSLDLRVSSFFGLTRGQTLVSSLFGLLFGGGLSLFGLVSLAWPERSLFRTTPANQRMVVEAQPGLKLTRQEMVLLQMLFHRYARLVLESEFLSGYSGARTFLGVPVKPDGRADASTIVKIGDRDAIRREFENYEAFVKDTLPPVTARIQHMPVSPRGEQRAAMQYTFIGLPGRSPVSLRMALLSDPDPALLFKLFDTFGPNWWMQRKPYTFRLAQEYDILLPAHLVIQPSAGQGVGLDGRTSPAGLNFKPGDLVTLKNFSWTERRGDGKSLSARGGPLPGQPPLRVRWLALANPNGRTGRVISTRRILLNELVAGISLYGMPDPLDRLPDVLAESLSGSQSIIHGDLNLENILVGPGEFVWLIDFAQTREGHPLLDFAHLEAEIIAHVLADQYSSPEAYVEAFRGESIPLLSALHSIAGRCLFNPTDAREYRLAQFAACLGALKHVNLGPHSRSLLYLTAACLGQSL
ncbi:MAG: hypothetical protein EHM70_11470 [Chloroflexota bacterium]|nr:MAG: hypothetical protein EHM70_11470 [Chloroflexota bacterium]